MKTRKEKLNTVSTTTILKEQKQDGIHKTRIPKNIYKAYKLDISPHFISSLNNIKKLEIVLINADISNKKRGKK